MKNSRTPFLRTLAALFPLLLLAGCPGGGSGSNSPPPFSGAITGTSRAVANQNYTYTATATNGTASTYAWTVDGNVPANSGSNPQETIWRAAGARNLSLTLTSTAGDTANLSQPIAVVDHPVSGGNQHTCAIEADNSVSCWGNNSASQLGDGKTKNRSNPLAVPNLAKVVSLAAYGNSTCAAKADGTVWCWGNQSGALTPTTMSVPQQVAGLANVVALAGGNGMVNDHICALQSTGEVACWGANKFGQLGNGTSADSTEPQLVVGISNAINIAASSDNTCALLANASVTCWGSAVNGIVNSATPANPTPVAVTGFSGNAVSLALSNNMGCVVTKTGSIECWGTNTGSQASNTALTSTPVAVAGISNVNALTLGNTHACALLMDATVTCWGTYFGTATTLPFVQPTPTAVVDGNGTPLDNVQAVSSGIDHTCASKLDGTIYCWGWNSSGQLGDGTAIDNMKAQPVTNAAVKLMPNNLVAASSHHSCTLPPTAMWPVGGKVRMESWAMVRIPTHLPP